MNLCKITKFWVWPAGLMLECDTDKCRVGGLFHHPQSVLRAAGQIDVSTDRRAVRHIERWQLAVLLCETCVWTPTGVIVMLQKGMLGDRPALHLAPTVIAINTIMAFLR